MLTENRLNGGTFKNTSTIRYLQKPRADSSFVKTTDRIGKARCCHWPNILELGECDSFYSSIDITGTMLIYTQNPGTFSTQFWINSKHCAQCCTEVKMLLNQKGTNELNSLVISYDFLNFAMEGR